MEIKPFKMRVTPEQSRIVQQTLFNNGYKKYYGDEIYIPKEPKTFIYLNKDINFTANNSDKNYTVLHLHSMLSNGVTNIDSVTPYYKYVDKAKELGMKSAVELNKALKDKKIQYSINGTWVMYSNYSNLGYEDIKQEILDSGKVVYHRKITQLGREFILNLFKKH